MGCKGKIRPDRPVAYAAGSGSSNIRSKESWRADFARPLPLVAPRLCRFSGTVPVMLKEGRLLGLAPIILLNASTSGRQARRRPAFATTERLQACSA